jgi:hypothetical protein
MRKVPLSADDRAVAFALLTEAPAARLRLPEAQLTTTERHAATLLRLLAVLGTVRCEDDDFAIAQALAVIDDAELDRIDAALAAIAVTRWRRPLDLCAQTLLRGVEGTASSDERVLQVALRYERYCRLVNRQFWHDDVIDDLESALAGYLDRESDSPAWNTAVREATMSGAALPGIAIRCDGSDGNLCVVLQIDSDRLAEPLQAWIAQARGTELFTHQARQPLSTIAKAFEDSRGRWPFHGMPKDRLVGKLLPDREPSIPAHGQLSGTQLDVTLQQLADTYAWSFVSWPNTMQQSALAFVTRDASLADRWTSLLRQHRCQHELIASYWNIASLQTHAGGTQFGEYNGYGEVALLAAAEDSVPPWLVVNVQRCSLHAWRRHTARLEVGAVAAHAHAHYTDFIGVYRADNVDAYHALWERLDYGDGIVQAAVCGHNSAEQVLKTFIAADYRSDFRLCNALSQRLGWIYTHVHGGGASEHHAMFHAKDPAQTNRVVAYAAKQPGWYLSGRW